MGDSVKVCFIINRRSLPGRQLTAARNIAIKILTIAIRRGTMEKATTAKGLIFKILYYVKDIVLNAF